MAYDLDGTVVVTLDRNAANPAIRTAGEVKGMNDESDSTQFLISNTFDARGYVTFIFPELRNLVAVFVSIAQGANLDENLITVSPDTTTGVDGTWNSFTSNNYNAFNGATLPNYRSSVQTLSSPQNNLKGVRFRFHQASSGQHFMNTIHLYGNPSTVMGTNDKLLFWHPTLDQQLGGAALDFGNSPRSSADTRQFRVKNCSPSKTANSVALSIDVPTDTSPTVASQHSLSLDGSTFTPTVNVGNLAPGAISGVVTLRRNLLSNAVLSLWTLRIPAVPSSWT